MYYPKIGTGKYKVFEVEYSFHDSSLKKIQEIIDILKLENKNKIQDLPPCPSYFHQICKFQEICK